MDTCDYRDTGERILPAEEGELSLVYTRHRFAYEQVLPLAENKTVLDVGCGSGYGAAMLAKVASRVVGVDYSDQAINYCRKNWDSPNLEFVQMDANKLELDSEFDLTVCFQAIEHMDDLDHFVGQLKKVTAKGGKILISTPNVFRPLKDDLANPFHVNEMNFDRFSDLLKKHFTEFLVIGVAYAKKNSFRSLIAKLPVYRWGRILKRKSKLKKIAARALDLDQFTIIDKNVRQSAADLLAICDNP